MQLPSEARWAEPVTTKGSENLFGVGVRHPTVSLMMDADAFSVGWL